MSYQKIDLPQGSPEWLKLRNTKMTASRIAQLFELKKNEDAFDLYNEMTGLVPPKPVGTFLQHAFQRGHEAEKVGRDWYESHAGKKFTPAVVVSKDHEFLMASLDGLNEDEEVLFEHKMVSSEETFENVKKGIIKEDHMLQIQAQMGICGYKKCIYFISLDRFDAEKKEFYFDSTYQEVPFDPAIFEQILDRSRRFMANLAKGIAPEPRIKRRKKKEAAV